MIAIRLMVLLNHIRATRIALTYERTYRRCEPEAVRLFDALVRAEGALNSAVLAAGRVRV